MNNPYVFHYWRRTYSEEGLAAAHRQHFVELARTDREPRQSGRLRFGWRDPLALLRGA
jgi:hypothetical protein